MGTRHSIYAKEAKSFTKIEAIKRPPSSVQLKRRRSSSVPAMLRKRSTITRACREISFGQLFSEHEQLLVLRSWLRHLNPVKEQFAIRTYQRVFYQAPELIQLFTSDPVNLSEIQFNTRFCLQAVKIVTFIDDLVKILDQPKNKLQELEIRLTDLGRRHVKHRGFGFTPYHWWVFHQCMIIALTEYLPEATTYSKADCILAWQKFISYMVETMKRGFDSAVYEQIPSVYDAYALSLEIGRRSRHASVDQEQSTSSTTPSPNGTLPLNEPRTTTRKHSARSAFRRTVRSEKTTRRVTYVSPLSSSVCEDEECHSSSWTSTRRAIFF